MFSGHKSKNYKKMQRFKFQHLREPIEPVNNETKSRALKKIYLNQLNRQAIFRQDTVQGSIIIKLYLQKL